MITVLQQVCPDDGLRGYELTLGKQGGGRDDLGRQFAQRGYVLGGQLRIFRLARHAIERRQGAPARRQRRIEIHRSQERINGAGSIAQRDVAMSALLEGSAETRVKFFE